MPNYLDLFEPRDNEPMLTPKGSGLLKRVFAALAGEPVVILAQLPEELRAPLQPFVRRGTECLTVSEIRRFYAAGGELMEDRAKLFSHQTELMNAASAYQLATAMAEFVNSLSAEDRALLQIQQHRR
jgi:hypothetical protein